MEKRPDFTPEPRGGRPHVRRHHGHHGDRDLDHFFGLDVEKMSPRAQVAAGLTVLIPVAVGAVFVLTQAIWLWWLIFVFGWAIFPAFGLLVRGIAGLSEGQTSLPATSGKERELLEALRDHGGAHAGAGGDGNVSYGGRG